MQITSAKMKWFQKGTKIKRNGEEVPNFVPIGVRIEFDNGESWFWNWRRWTRTLPLIPKRYRDGSLVKTPKGEIVYETAKKQSFGTDEMLEKEMGRVSNPIPLVAVLFEARDKAVAEMNQKAA